MQKLTARLRTVRRTIGSTQPGFLTMSSNVFFGEKKTPVMRPNGLTVASASDAGTGVVAIEDSSTTRLRSSAFSRGTTHEHRGIFQRGDSSAPEMKLTVESYKVKGKNKR